MVSTGVALALTIGLPAFFVVFVLFRRSKPEEQLPPAEEGHELRD
jgi:hypothetical protein